MGLYIRNILEIQKEERSSATFVRYCTTNGNMEYTGGTLFAVLTLVHSFINSIWKIDCLA